MNLVAELLAASPVVLAPMEDITDAAFRRICRELGASLCMTEFIGAEQLVADSVLARRRAALPAGDHPTAIQIYGADPDLLMAAARIAESAAPAFIDLNCGCWIPKIARRGAGAGWLRNPTAMVEMARRVVQAVSLPVTVKTRIGFDDPSVFEQLLPIFARHSLDLLTVAGPRPIDVDTPDALRAVAAELARRGRG